VQTDLEIAQGATLEPIVEIARGLGLGEADLDLYGRYKAKVHLDVSERLKDRPLAKYIGVTAITPTPLGEGKTVVTIGLAEALDAAGHRAVACIRQPSMGPTFGVKGGAAGGGRAQVEPMEDMNLHLTGDLHAVSAAQNLLAAAIDSHLFHGNALGLDPYSIGQDRVLDINDRALRHAVIGLGGREDGLPRQAGWDLTAGSEVMAILSLATDLEDLRARLGRMVVGSSREGRLITADDLRVAGAMAVLLKDALMPNLLQTLEGSPVFVHTGPFGNTSHGNSSIVADQVALRLADYVVTESGFGADMGLEKFIDIKGRASGLAPDCIIVVATARALKMHGGAGKVVAGRPLPPEVTQENLAALEKGCSNLVKQIENAVAFGAPVVAAVNRFTADRSVEIELIRRKALEAGAEAACEVQVWARGGAGGCELAEAVIEACGRSGHVQPLYPDQAPVREKIETIARRLYGAAGVDFSPEAARSVERLTRLGFGGLPVCMAKTHLSLSHDPRLLGAPTGYRLPVRDLRPWAGAGFLHALCGDIRTMPGLPARPAYENIDLVDGRVVGLA
jgi:formate--tetrahydrofolate ligase